MWRAALREWAAYPDLRAQLVAVRDADRFGPVAVWLVTADRLGERWWSPWVHRQRLSAIWLARHDVRASVRHVVVPGAPHMLMLTHPEDVAGLMRDLLAAVTGS